MCDINNMIESAYREAEKFEDTSRRSHGYLQIQGNLPIIEPFNSYVPPWLDNDVPIDWHRESADNALSQKKFKFPEVTQIKRYSVPLPCPIQRHMNSRESAVNVLSPKQLQCPEVTQTKTDCFPLAYQQQLSRLLSDEGQAPKFKFDPEQRADCLYTPAAVPDVQSIPECTEIMVSSTDTVVPGLQNMQESREIMVSSTDTGGVNQSNFKKAEDNSLSELALSSYLRSMQSVGALIRDKQLVGTVFRVGTSYVMTAWHCIYSIIFDPFMIQTMEAQLQKLQDTNVCIHFSPSLITPLENIFYVEGLCYADESLDVAVLKLAAKSGVPPNPQESLKLCRNPISDDHSPSVDIIGFGHPSKQFNLKMLEPSCKLISPNDQSVANAKWWFQQEEPRLTTASQTGKKALGYDGIERMEKMLFSCYAEHGISGGPILSSNDPQHIYVIGIVTNGLPHCLWDIKPTHRACIPLDYRFEMGTRMNYIYSDIVNKCPKLAQDIFS